MGIQVAIRVEDPDPDSDSGLMKAHGPTRPKGGGHSKYPYLSFPDPRHPWKGSVSDGLRAFARWLDEKRGLERAAVAIKIHAVRSPEEVRGRAAQRDAEAYLERSS